MKCKCGKTIDHYDHIFYIGRCVDCVMDQIFNPSEDIKYGLLHSFKKLWKREGQTQHG